MRKKHAAIPEKEEPQTMEEKRDQIKDSKERQPSKVEKKISPRPPKQSTGSASASKKLKQQ